MKKTAAIFGDQERQIDYVYSNGRKERVAEYTDLYPHLISQANMTEHIPHLQDLEVIFSTWGMPALDVEQLKQLPNLEIVFYSAGSVQKFARPFLENNIQVCSAWQANGVPVAEYTIAQILLANKGYYRNIRDCQTYEGRRNSPFKGRGNFGATVALLGAGAIGRQVIELLEPFHLDIVVFDPYLPDTAADDLGVRRVSLEDAFKEGDVVSNHLAVRRVRPFGLHRGRPASLRQLWLRSCFSS